MPAKATGKRPGDLCPGCKEGRLTVRTKDHSDEPADFMRVVIGHRYKHWTTITRLVCGSCSGVYEAADRGKDVKEVLEAQLKGFENPTEMPTVCGTCGGELADQEGGEPDDFLAPRFRSCEACLTVAWIIPEEQPSKTGYSPAVPGRRMPSPPPIAPESRRRGR